MFDHCCVSLSEVLELLLGVGDNKMKALVSGFDRVSRGLDDLPTRSRTSLEYSGRFPSMMFWRCVMMFSSLIILSNHSRLSLPLPPLAIVAETSFL